MDDQGTGKGNARPPGNKKAEEISVTCYSGFRLNERPVKFKYCSKEFLIKKILDSSVTESLEDRTRRYCFKVLCETGEIFTIFFDTREDRWFLY